MEIVIGQFSMGVVEDFASRLRENDDQPCA